MKTFVLISCAAVLAAAQFVSAVRAEPVTRLKARLTGFDGAVMTLVPLPAKDAAAPPGGKAPAPSLTVTLLPETRIVASGPSGFADIKPGDYVGATVTEARGGRLKAQDVYRYAEPLRGTGEGRFTDNGRLLVNGTVTKAQPTAPQDTADGILTLHYRGAVLSPAGAREKVRTVCEGRATPAPFASALACAADAVVEVLPGTPVTALTVGDRNLLVPGSIVTVSITKLSDRNVAPGVIVEKDAPRPIPNAAPLEKPQTPQ